MFNKVILMGRLCANPELKMMQSGTSSCGFRLAVARRFKSRETGETETDFINCISWSKTADFISKYFHKGDMIIVEGSLRNNDYTDKSGTKHYSMKVHVDKAAFGGGGSKQKQEGTYGTNPGVQNPSDAEISSEIGDLSDFEEILADGALPF